MTPRLDTPASLFCGSTLKILQNGCQRSITPAATWARLEPTLARYGVTRLANVTGLDRIGIPVYMAVRPNSRGLSVSQGKGLDAMSAKVSAAAESIECWHAERPLNPVLLERYTDLCQRASVVDPSHLPLSRDSSFSPGLRVPWVEATDVITKASIWVPFEMVHADATLPRTPGSGSFVFSTNGLASGNSQCEALLHAVCELIERDAIALWKSKDEESQHATRIDPSTVDDPVCEPLLRRFSEAGILPMLWDTSSDISVPVFRVLIFDDWSSSQYTPYPTAFGAGCHPNKNIALARALTEAAQSRLTVIAGSRDDGTRQRYHATQASEAADYHRALAARPGHVSFDLITSMASQTVEEDMDYAISSLKQKGLSQVLMIDLSRQDSPLAIVRCIVPGLEGPSSSPSYVGGARFKAAAS